MTTLSKQMLYKVDCHVHRPQLTIVLPILMESAHQGVHLVFGKVFGIKSEVFVLQKCEILSAIKYYRTSSM